MSFPPFLTRMKHFKGIITFLAHHGCVGTQFGEICRFCLSPHCFSLCGAGESPGRGRWSQQEESGHQPLWGCASRQSWCAVQIPSPTTTGNILPGPRLAETEASHIRTLTHGHTWCLSSQNYGLSVPDRIP